MDAPSPDDVRARSGLLAELFPAGSAGDTALTVLIGDDAPVVGRITGRIIAGTDGEDVPVPLVPVAVHVIALRLERRALAAQPEARRKALSNLYLRSISAGPWSESYARPEEVARANVLDPDPLVHEQLWALATEDAREEWMRLWGVHAGAPATATQSVNWGLRGELRQRGNARRAGLGWYGLSGYDGR